MRAAVSADRVWPIKAYFEAKVAEQQDRHLKANDTAYNLEPNVKTGPGGLRDIQTIAWVAKRHFGASSLDELLTHGFLSPSELRKLKQAQSFLWKVRFGLHVLTGRREDRLLFDHQIKLAQSFGYEDASYTLAVEQFMQRYYRTVMDVSLLNELLLQLFREAILTETAPPRPLIAALPGAQRLPRSGERRTVRAHAVDAARAVRGAAAEPGRERRARLDHPRRQQEPVADRRGVPPEPAQPSPVPRDPARAGRRDARAAPHEHLRRAGPLHSRRSAASSGACSTTCSTPTPSMRTRCSC